MRSFFSLGAHSTDRVISLTKPKQKSSLASLLIANLVLPRFMMPRRFWASTCTPTSLPMHRCTKAWRHRRTPKISRKVENSTLSSQVKYSLAVKSGPPRVWPPHAKSLASVATLMETPFWERQFSVSNLRRGSYCQNNYSLTPSSEREAQQLSDHTVFNKSYRCLVYSWHTGPHAKLIEITVPTKLASVRARTRPPFAMSRASVEN